LFVVAIMTPLDERRWGSRLRLSDSLRVDDYAAIRQQVTGITAISPHVFIPTARVQAQGQILDAKVEGISIDGFKTVPRRLVDGTLFSPIDVSRALNVCVVSSALARKVFRNGRAVGQSVSLYGNRFTIIG